MIVKKFFIAGLLLFTSTSFANEADSTQVGNCYKLIVNSFISRTLHSSDEHVEMANRWIGELYVDTRRSVEKNELVYKRFESAHEMAKLLTTASAVDFYLGTSRNWVGAAQDGAFATVCEGVFLE